jgi:hypothetical protein
MHAIDVEILLVVVVGECVGIGVGSEFLACGVRIGVRNRANRLSNRQTAVTAELAIDGLVGDRRVGRRQLTE